jgi:hypothetical protein
MFVHACLHQKRGSIPTKILQDLPEEREKLLEEESQLPEPESLLEPSPTSAISDPEPPKKEDFLMNMEISRITM